jgi:hypothetical protein
MCIHHWHGQRRINYKFVVACGFSGCGCKSDNISAVDKAKRDSIGLWHRPQYRMVNPNLILTELVKAGSSMDCYC